MGKIDISMKVMSDPFVISKLFPAERLDNCAVICCNQMGSDRQLLQEFDHNIRHDLSCLALDLSQEC